MTCLSNLSLFPLRRNTWFPGSLFRLRRNNRSLGSLFRLRRNNRVFAIGLLLSGFLLAGPLLAYDGVPQPGDPDYDRRLAEQPLTCSMIATQCRTACTERGGGLICPSYCGTKQEQCLRTGRWDGMVERFDKVERR